MKIAICDDDEYYREQIGNLLKKYISQNKNREISLSVFSDPEELLEVTKKNGGFDIFILDIVMTDMNGIELGHELRENGYDGKIIYLTSSEEFAVDSYSVGAFNYILKPWKDENVISILDKAVLSVLNKTEKYILVKTKESSIKIPFDSVLYAELADRSIVYHLTNGKIIESTTLRTKFIEAIQCFLGEKSFILCGASRLINMRHITEIDKEAVIFDENKKVFFSKKICRDLRTAWIDFCFSEVEYI